MIEILKQSFLFLGWNLILPPVSFPVVAALVLARRQWEKEDPVQRNRYALRKRWGLGIPFLITLEMVVLAVRHDYLFERGNGTTTTAFNQEIDYLFFSLIPLMAWMIWRLRSCWRFALWICLAQLWLAIAIWIAIWFRYLHL